MFKRILIVSAVFLIPIIAKSTPYLFANQILNDTIIIEGKILDSETKKPIKARISYERIPTRDDIGILFSDSATGNYKIYLQSASQYKITIQAPEFITSYEKMDLNDTVTLSNLQEVLMVPLKVGQVIVMNRITFERGKDKLLPESYSELDNIYKMLSEHQKMVIQLEGHTDNAGSSSANLKLSEGRVNAVRSYLVNKGIKKNRIEVKAFGGSKPVANNSTEEGRIKNRRVEIRILRN
jgi:outer membrane protein OmpA-like peptidoglycan-associated protein